MFEHILFYYLANKTWALLQPYCKHLFWKMISKYLIYRRPSIKKIWTKAFQKELENLALGVSKINTTGTKTVFFLSQGKIPAVSEDRTITYARVMFDSSQQKSDPNIICTNADEKQISCPHDSTRQTTGMVTLKICFKYTPQ